MSFIYTVLYLRLFIWSSAPSIARWDRQRRDSVCLQLRRFQIWQSSSPLLTSPRLFLGSLWKPSRRKVSASSSPGPFAVWLVWLCVCLSHVVEICFLPSAVCGHHAGRHTGFGAGGWGSGREQSLGLCFMTVDELTCSYCMEIIQSLNIEQV